MSESANNRFDSTLAVLKPGYRFSSNKCAVLCPDIFQTHVLLHLRRNLGQIPALLASGLVISSLLVKHQTEEGT